MSGSTGWGIDQLDDARQVAAADQICDAFESAWRSGHRPRLEDSVAALTGEQRTALLVELIPLDVEYRRRLGELPQPSEYLARFPDLDPIWLTALFANSLGEPAGNGNRFQLLQRVGLGACGAVWRALDTRLQRTVALKVPHPGLVSSPEALERFHREARAAAQLRHPGIVTVHEVTAHQGLPALVEDFIDGEPLRDLLARRRLTYRETAQLIAEVAEALHYAHRMGAVHRDIKPANIMVKPDGPAGELRPLLVDFGLARNGGAEITLTLEGQIVGTPAYMSPEQAGGEGHGVDRRTDVYSLGVVLYEMLTGELPFRGGKALLLQQILHEEPRRPRSVNPAIPRDLETVCLKAMARELDRRYASAGDLADDLRRFLRGEPVRARPVGWAERGLRWVRRRPTLAALAGVSGLAALALFGVAWAALDAARLRDAFAETDRLRGEQTTLRARAEAGLYHQRVLLASREWSAGNVGRTQQLLEDCEPALRGWEWNYLRGLCHTDLLTLRHRSVRPGWWTVTSVAWSPDGKWLLSGCKDGGVHLWDAATGHHERLLGTHEGGVMAVAWGSDSRHAASAGLDQIVRIWDTVRGTELHILQGHYGHVYSVAFSPDGRQLASGSGEWLENIYPVNPGRAEVRLWDVNSGRKLRSWPAGPHDVVGLAFHPDGRTLAAACGSWMARPGRGAPGELILLPLDGAAARRILRGHAGPLTGVVYSPDGKYLATSSLDQTVKIWDAVGGTEVNTLRGHRDWVRGVAFSPDGRRVASAGADAVVKVWGVPKGDELLTLRGHTQAVSAVAFRPDGRRLASAAGDQSIKIWDAVREPEGPRYVGHAGAVVALGLSPDGTVCYSAANPATGGEVHAWRTDTARRLREYQGSTAPINVLAVSADGRFLAAGRNDGTVQIWETATGRKLSTAPGHVGSVRGLAFTADSQRLLSVGLHRDVAAVPNDGAGGWQQEFQVCDLAHGKMQRLASHAGIPWPRSLAIHPQEDVAIVGDDRGTVRLWDMTSLGAVTEWSAHERVVCGLAFRADGKRLASASWDNTVKVWDVTSRQAICTLRGHSRNVLGVAFSPDGRRLASAGEDRMVKLWNPESGWETLTLTGHADIVTAVAFSPDGRRLLSASLDGTVKVWQAGH